MAPMIRTLTLLCIIIAAKPVFAASLFQLQPGVIRLAASETSLLDGTDASDKKAAAETDSQPIYNWRGKNLRINQGFFSEGGTTSLAHFSGGLTVDATDKWRVEAFARLDGVFDNHNMGVSSNRYSADFDALYLQWRGDGQSRATFGYQIVRWGKTDEISPVDRVVREDWSRPFEDLADRRRALPLFRYEYFGEGYSLDAVVRPWFAKAEMPRLESTWSPIDQRQGRILGFEPDPLMSALVTAGRFVDEAQGDAGWGARLSSNGKGLDWAVSLQRWRRSSPYYAVDLSGPVVFQAQHPFSYVWGAELAATLGAVTTRAEATYLSAEPVTTRTLAYATVPAFEAVLGIDWWPGDKDTLVVMQLAGRQLDTGSRDILDRTHSLALTGSVRSDWGRGNWQARLRYSVGLDKFDNYFNPAITWLGWESNQLTFGAHFFSGSAATPGGFYKNNDALYFEWRSDL